MKAGGFLARGWALALLLLALALPAQAGRDCVERRPAPDEAGKALELADRVQRALDRSGASVALIGRVGSDQSARGVRYTHVGYVQRDHPRGRWTVTHVLNICGGGNSEIYDEGLGNFFLDEVFAFESSLVIPTPDTQRALLRVLNGPGKRALHQPVYSLIAYPWSTRYQNSDGWAVEVAAAALAGPGRVGTRADAQAWLKAAGFVPTPVRIGPAERAGTRLFAANVRYGDHPDEAWQQWRYQVVSGDSVLDFLHRADAGSRRMLLRLGEEEGEAREARVVVVQPGAEGPPEGGSAAPARPEPSARAAILEGTRSLVVGYACRPEGYLRQCRQLEASACGEQVGAAVAECFAPIPDAELAGAQRASALAAVERVGWCAAESVDRRLGPAGKRGASADGRSCADIHAYR